MCVFVFQSIPRSIVLGKSGRQLVQWPIKEIEKLRRKEVFNLDDKELKGGSVFEVSGVMASQVNQLNTLSYVCVYQITDI